jgi:hypothetical protein
MTVAELRAALAAFPDDMVVMAEGCDCTGTPTCVRELATEDDDEQPVTVALVCVCEPDEKCDAVKRSEP